MVTASVTTVFYVIIIVMMTIDDFLQHGNVRPAGLSEVLPTQAGAEGDPDGDHGDRNQIRKRPRSHDGTVLQVSTHGLVVQPFVLI